MMEQYINPVRILWQSKGDKQSIIGSEYLLEDRSAQITIVPNQPCVMENLGEVPSILLDFGKELHGGIQIFCWRAFKEYGTSVRIRFGESAMEAMSDLGGESNATNNHALRDLDVRLVDMSMTPVGRTGFRFVRIDLLDEGSRIELKTIKAVQHIRNDKYIGSFYSSDELLNKIWNIGAYTVHLNMQEYIWDGIKRDRLVWMGDMHPEIMTIMSVFGHHSIVGDSLDFVRDDTPLPGWINNMPTYSMWWIISQHDWYFYTGDIEYLKEQREYLLGLSKQMNDSIDKNGKDSTPEHRFVDWPSSTNPEGVDNGIQAIHYMATKCMKELFKVLEEEEAYKECEDALLKLEKYKTDPTCSKQSAALLVLAGLADAAEVNESTISIDNAKGYSTFMAYYILKAKALAGDYSGALSSIREYFGGMITLGATTFWEDFDLEWLKNGAPIDEITEEGKINVHASYGAYCYKGYRHSLCHGWAGAVSAWLSQYVLGIHYKNISGTEIELKPQLCDLKFVEGSYPTKYGVIRLKYSKLEDGAIHTDILECPSEITLIQ